MRGPGCLPRGRRSAVLIKVAPTSSSPSVPGQQDNSWAKDMLYMIKRLLR